MCTYVCPRARPHDSAEQIFTYNSNAKKIPDSVLNVVKSPPTPRHAEHASTHDNRITNLSTWPLRQFLENATCQGAHVMVVMQQNYCTVSSWLALTWKIKPTLLFHRVLRRYFQDRNGVSHLIHPCIVVNQTSRRLSTIYLPYGTATGDTCSLTRGMR